MGGHTFIVCLDMKKERVMIICYCLFCYNDKSALVNSSSKISQNLNTDLLYDIIDVNATITTTWEIVYSIYSALLQKKATWRWLWN